MTDQWDAHFFRLPAGASRRDRQVGYTEMGSPLYEAPNGTRYSFDGSLNAPKQTQPSSPNMLVNRTLPDGRVYHDYAPRQNQNALAATDVISGLAQGLANPFMVPGRALRGEPVTYGDVLELAAATNLGASMFETPKGAVRSGSMRTADEPFGDGYIRRSRNADTPDNGVGYSMFAKGNPEYDDAISSYGDYGWFTNADGAVDVSEIQPDIVRSIRRRGLHDDYQATAAQLAREADPDDIVNSAGLWDAPDLVEAVWEDVLDPKGITKVMTRDGLLLFDPGQARRYLSIGGTGIGGAAVGLNALAPQQADAQEIIDYLSRRR